MNIFNGNVKNREILEKWRHELGIRVNPNVHIEETKGHGIGVFYNNVKSNQEKDEEDIELLRIPFISSYNIHTLKELVNTRLDENDKKVVKKCLNLTFINSNRMSESLILIAYFIGFLMICKKRKKNEIGKEKDKKSWKNDIEIYLTVLLDTNVGNLYSDHQDILQDFLSYFPGNAILSNLIFDVVNTDKVDLIEKINKEFEEEFEKIKIEEFLQICAAIRSRVLEIPKEIEDNNEEYYEVNVTLVPLLDYVNHDNDKKNAYFDIDKINNDIILYLENEKVKDNYNEIEVFISYDSVEDLHSMFTTYGFIPISEGIEKFIEIPIIGYCDNSKILNDFEATRRLYCIGQSPNVQFKVKFNKIGEIEEISVIDCQFYSYLIFNEGIDWDKFESEDVNDEAEEEDNNQIDFEMGVNFERGFERSIEIEKNMTINEINKLKEIFCEYLLEGFSKLNEKSDNFSKFIKEYELQDQSLNILKLLNLYQIMSKFIKSKGNIKFDNLEDNHNDKQDIILNARMIPLYNFEATVDNVEISDMKI